MFMFFVKNRLIIFLCGAGVLSLTYVSIYYEHPWFILASTALIGIAIFYAEVNKTQSLQDIGLGVVIGFAIVVVIVVNTAWAGVLVLTHILDPAFYQEYAGNFASFSFLYHFVYTFFFSFYIDTVVTLSW